MKKLKSSAKSPTAGFIRKVIGAKDDEEVIVVTPQFERSKTSPTPSAPPRTRKEWDNLRKLTKSELRALGLRGWDGKLMLFPAEWYYEIPNGMLVEDIFGHVEKFERRKFDNDQRVGCLAYGVPAVDGVKSKESE